MFGFNWLDIIFAVILGSFMLTALRRGLIRSIFGIVSFIASVLISSQLYTKVATFIKVKTPFYSLFNQMLNNALNLSGSLVSNIKIDDASNIFGEFKTSTEFSQELLNNIQLPAFIKENFLKINSSKILQIFDLKTLGNFISNNLANVLVNILAMVITFSLISLIFSIAAKLLDIIAWLPGINMANRLGGLVIGFIQGTIVIWVGCMLIALFVEDPKFKFFKHALASSRFAIKFYDSNLILKFLARYIPGF